MNENINGEPAFRLGYLRALDGLRGLAILLVLLTHLELASNMYGFIGVDLFFVLSGFLITCLLIEEWDQTGGISLRAFYARRALRLFPALVVMIAAFLVYSHFFHQPKIQRLEVKEALYALFYSTNWAAAIGRAWSGFLAHTWSLSIEEQFYLIWPLLLLLLVKRCSRKSLFSFLLLAIVLVWFERFLLASGTASTSLRLARGLDTRADSLLTGCAVGVLLSSRLLPRPESWGAWLWWGTAISFVGLGVLCRFDPDAPWMYDAGWLLISLLGGGIVLGLTATSGGIFHRALGCAPLVWLGRISYGLYVWHFPIFQALDEAGFKPAIKYWPLRLGLCLFAAIVSYYAIERPFLRLKRRFQKAK